ncbi:hypothetical protein [Salinicoccus halodurans]|uniref:Phage protein n=1 Tax=Salinicoccus halodurans TaxID=407035 RepID=A0A0F7HLV6_9STAP|nr:hypothetical protein [Salinicoccus halodurans]AKG74362.1 phage protein [Salinicoccus halodurans]SFK94981.1 hypothetical protein SAMN05216235_2701 [Salinicoccus halodurans]
MKFIFCQPAIKRFEWELEVTITNLKALGIDRIVLLFAKWDDAIPLYLKDKYDVEVHVYDDRPRDKSYIPSVKPYLWWQYLKEDASREKDTYFYLDSDVILREPIDFNAIPYDSDNWIGSDCEGYLGVDYIDSKGEDLLKRMCEVIGIDESIIRRHRPIAGAQWIISHPTAEYWRKVYEDSIKLYRFFNEVENEYINKNKDIKGYTPIQKWTAEMWAQLWNVYYFDKQTDTHKEMNFTWPGNPVDQWYENKIFHNAGVLQSDTDMFFKGKYTTDGPFKDDLNHVSENKASIKYVDAIKQVKFD